MTRHLIELTSPAGEVRDGFPLGNGGLGVTLYGRPGLEWFDLTADTLWSGGPLPPGSEVLQALRRAIAAGDHLTADALAGELRGDALTRSCRPLGRIEWCYADDQEVTGYHRHLDLADAVAVTGYDSASGPVRLTGSVSAPDGVLLVTAAGPGSLAAAVLPRLRTPHPVTAGVVDAGAGPCLLWMGQATVPACPADHVPAVVYAAGAGLAFAVAAAVRCTAAETHLVVAAATGCRGPGQPTGADLAGAALARVARALALPARHRLRRSRRSSRPDPL